MATFVTGATGYLGAHAAAELLRSGAEGLNLLVRAKDVHEAELRLWRALQLHLDFPRFHDYLRSSITIFPGDLSAPRFGLDGTGYRRLMRGTDSILHCAASLNRRSEKSCLNVNLRGTLEVMKLAAAARDDHGLRRFSHVSTVAVAGHRHNEVVSEEEAIDWERSDYDPYARSKKFCEHMLREWLPDIPRTIFRPSIVLGDSRYPQTTQFDMVRSFVFLAGLPVLPFRPGDRLDIVPVDFVARALVKLHLKERPDHEIYHLSSGLASESFETLTHALARAMNRRPAHYLAGLGRPFKSVVEVLARRRGTAVGHAASLLKVFLPYLVWNTVFDNSRAVKEVGEAPVPFSRYCYPLLKFSRDGHFTYPYTDWPPDSKVQKPELRRTGAEAEESNLRHDSRPAIPTPKSKIV